MKRKSLERATDALLAMYERDPDRPTWSEHQLFRRMVGTRRNDSRHDPLRLKDLEDPLLLAELHGLIRSAALSPSQRRIVQLKVEGWTFSDIARARGVTLQAVRNSFLRSVKKIACRSHVYPYRGLSEVYRAETRRRPPKGWVW